MWRMYHLLTGQGMMPGNCLLLRVPWDGSQLLTGAESDAWCGCHAAGQPFNTAGGPSGKQGMLHVLLRDRRSGQRILAATTHLKAKGGQVGGC